MSFKHFLQMSYVEINQRLREIKEEIHSLRTQKIFNISDKIAALKQVNNLLKEQNYLLSQRQTMIKDRSYLDTQDATITCGIAV